MSWEQVRFGDDSGIFAVVEQVQSVNEAGAALVMTFAGLGQAMSEKNYFFSNLRKRLSGSGHTFVQFDYYGHGDSFLELGDASVSSMVEDAETVFRSVQLRDRHFQAIFIGNGLGGLIALKTADRISQLLGIPIHVICVSPPLEIPSSTTIFSSDILELLAKEVKLDSQLLVPGSDYYTLSDFNEKQYTYFTKLGSHMLYLHGQCIAYRMLQELDLLRPLDLLRQCSNRAHVIHGELDRQSASLLSEIDDLTSSILPNVMYYHQHPQAMDEAIEIIRSLIEQTVMHAKGDDNQG